MPLERADLEQIGSYVKEHLSDWLVEVATPLAMGPQIMERFARVEERIVDVDERLLRLDGKVSDLNDRTLVVQEELKHQRELIATRFEASDRRFEEMQAYLDKRFEAVDRRFEAVDRRFEDMHTSMNTRFASADKRFASVDKRFEDLISNMNKRFAETRWMMGGVVVLLATMMSLYQFLG